MISAVIIKLLVTFLASRSKQALKRTIFKVLLHLRHKHKQERGFTLSGLKGKTTSFQKSEK